MNRALARVVEGFSVTLPDRREPTRNIELLPDASTSIMWLAPHGSMPVLAVAGPRMRARTKTVPRKLSVVARLAPGAASVLFDTPLERIAGGYASLDDLWGDDAKRLADELATTRDPGELVARFARAIHRRASRRHEPAPARLAMRAIRILRESEPPPGVEELAATLGVTARHLRRAFGATVGIGPKDFTRVVRIQRAIKASQCDAWSDVARRAGYYDQAHMIANFREMLGTTPRAFAARRAFLAPTIASVDA